MRGASGATSSQRAERESWCYRDFLTLLVAEEIAHRQQTRLARLSRRAHFPFLKTIDDFNFTYQIVVAAARCWARRSRPTSSPRGGR